MNILWVVSTFPSPQRPTAGVFLEQLASALSMGCRLTVLTRVAWLPFGVYRANGGLNMGGGRLGEFHPYAVQRVRVPYVPQLGWPAAVSEDVSVGLSQILSACWLLGHSLRGRPRPDLVHAHMGLNLVLGAVLATRYGVPLVSTVQGSDVNFGLDRRRGNGMRRLSTLMGLRKSRRVIAVSRALADKLRANGLPSDGIAQVPNGFDGSRFHPMDRLAARDRLGLPGEGTVILTVGNLVPVKGTDIVIGAFDRLRRTRDTVRLVCVGGGPEAQRLEADIRARGLQDRVVLAGQRPHEEIPLWMNACDLFVMGSRSEGWPTVLSEVLACGRPVVATAVGGVPEIVNDSVGAVVEPENPQALADAIDRTLQRPFDPEAISVYAQRFEWGQIVPQVLNVYRDAIVSWKDRRTRRRTELQ